MKLRAVGPGLLVCLGVAAVATAIGSVLPLVGSVLPAILIGVVAASIRRPHERLRPGIRFTSKILLQCAVVLLGAQLSLGAIARVGLTSLPVMLTSLAVCLAVSVLLGRALGVERRLRTLIGVGTGICGASAIAAVAPVIGAAGAEVAYAVSTIFLFNLVAVLAFPLVGHLLGMSPEAFGLFAGTAVNDTSSVVAAAGIFGSAALGTAVVVKLVRTLMLVPITVGLAIGENRREAAGQPMTVGRAVRLVPWFLVGFLVVAVLNTVLPVPEPAREATTRVSVFLVTAAMAGVGLSTDLRGMRAAGWRPLLLGGLLSLVVTATTLVMMAVTGVIG